MGSVNLNFVFNVTKQIAAIVSKSTVPIGIGFEFKKIIDKIK